MLGAVEPAPIGDGVRDELGTDVVAHVVPRPVQDGQAVLHVHAGRNHTRLDTLSYRCGGLEQATLRPPPTDRSNTAVSNGEASVRYGIMHCKTTGFIHRARPRNAFGARSITTTCSVVSRPTRAWTFELLTVVSLSIITSLSWSVSAANANTH